MSNPDERNPAECPPGESLTQWMKRGARGRKKPRTPTEQRLHDRILREIDKLVPDAIAQAKKGKPALLRMILRATR